MDCPSDDISRQRRGVRPTQSSALPDGLRHYRSTPAFNHVTLPLALRGDHSTKSDVWGFIRVLTGMLRYSITDPGRNSAVIDLTPHTDPGIIEPAVIHRVEPLGEVEFRVEFYRAS